MRPRYLHARQSKRFIERRQWRVSMILGLVVVAVGTWLFSLSRLSDLDMFAIADVRVNGADEDIAAAIQAAAANALTGDYAGLFSKANSFLYPRAAVTAAVLSSSARILRADVARDGLQALSVNVTERTPSAVICSGLPDIVGTTLSFQNDETCYFADERGFIFKPAPGISGDLYDRYYFPDLADASGAGGGPIGSYATSTDEFAALQTFYDGARHAGIGPESVLVKSDGEYELYAHNPTVLRQAESAGLSAASSTEESAMDRDVVVVYFNDARPLTDELANLAAFWTSMTDKARAEKKVTAFEYIDVRYGSNVFYRLAN